MNYLVGVIILSYFALSIYDIISAHKKGTKE